LLEPKLSAAKDSGRDVVIFFSSFDAGGIVDYRFEDGRFRTSASHVTILNLIRLQAVKTGVNA
jgi:hypothetical protein